MTQSFYVRVTIFGNLNYDLRQVNYYFIYRLSAVLRIPQDNNDCVVVVRKQQTGSYLEINLGNFQALFDFFVGFSSFSKCN